MIPGGAAEAAKTLVGEASGRSQSVDVMILVIAEHRGGALNRATWETVAAAQGTGEPVKVAVLGQGVDAVGAELAAADVSQVILVDAPALAEYTADGFVQAVQGLVDAEKPERVYLPHTYQTRDFAPAVATKLQRPLVTDCVAVKADGGSVDVRAGRCFRASFRRTS